MSIDRSNFGTWKHDCVTSEVLQHFETLRDDIEEQLIDPQFIMSDSFEKYSKYLAGKLDVINALIDITYLDLNIPEESSDHA